MTCVLFISIMNLQLTGRRGRMASQWCCMIISIKNCLLNEQLTLDLMNMDEQGERSILLMYL